jgi:hypothetical protein
MDVIFAAIDSDLAGTLILGRTLLGAFFILACFFMFIGIFSTKEANWSGLILRLVIGFVLLQNYIEIMSMVRDIITGIDTTINPDISAADQYMTMSENMQAIYEENQQSGFSLAVFGKKTLYNLTINLSFIFYAMVSNIMQAIRYTVAGIIYKLGPLFVPFIVFPSMVNVLSGWFRSYVSVLCWPILWHIVLSIAVTLSASIDPTLDGIDKFVMLNFAVCFVLIYSPMIVASFASGSGIGGAASMAALGAVHKLTQYVRQGGRVATGGLAGGIDGAAGAIAGGELKTIIPQTLAGVMKGAAEKAGIQLSLNEQRMYGVLRNKLSRKNKEQDNE